MSPTALKVTSRTALLLALLAAVVVAAGLVGITYAVATHRNGASNSAPTTTAELKAGQPSALLTQRQIDGYPAASAQHALLVWWRAAQFADYHGYLSGFALQVRRKVAADPQRMEVFGRLTGFTIDAAPKVLGFQRTPAGADLYTEIAYRAKAPDGKVVAFSRPHVFQLVRQGGAWRLGNDDFVQELLPHSLLRK